MYNVLITGVAGFIGSNLADFLLNKGFKVYGLDNLITGDKKNIEHLSNNPKFEFIESDVTNFIKIKDKLDFVLHFAWFQKMSSFFSVGKVAFILLTNSVAGFIFSVIRVPKYFSSSTCVSA